MMKNILPKIFLLIAVVAVGAVFLYQAVVLHSNKNNADIFQAGTYVLYQDGTSRPGEADLVFNEDGSCHLRLTDALSSYALISGYTLEGDRLVYADDRYTYTFRVTDEDTLVYLGGESVPCESFCRQLEDGAVFTLVVPVVGIIPEF